MSHYDFSLGASTDKQKPKKTERSNNVLEGFVKADKPMPSVPSYPPPALPRDYVPVAAGSRRSRFEPTTATPRDQGLGRHELSAEARGALLGETPIPKLPDTNTDTQTHKDIIEKVVGRNVNFVTSSEEKSDTKAEDFIPIKDSGKDLEKVFKPFVSDPKKQARYEMYLKNKDGVGLEKDSGIDRLSEWERNREMMEFEQAAKLYKPLSGIMEERFTHASQPDDALNPLTAVAKSSNDYGIASEEQIKAAEMGAYGLITRREISWRPESVVCKRFNVPEPGSTREELKKEDKPKVSYSIFSYLETSVHDKESFAKEQSKFSGSKSLNVDPNTSKQTKEDKKETDKKDPNKIVPKITPITTTFNKRMTVAELFLKESERDLKTKEVADVTETIQKFDKMDLYKSIFLSDSENEDDVDESNNANSKNDNIKDSIFEKPKNIERNTSPPRGIFANIDFDEINSWKRKAEAKKSDNPPSSTKEVEVKSNDANSAIAKTNGDNKTIPEKPDDGKMETDYNQADVYGPKIPENLKKRLEAPSRDDFKPMYRSKDEREIHQVDSSSESDSWVEAKKAKSKKEKKKKSKKHKSKHKKSKHKKKDR